MPLDFTVVINVRQRFGDGSEPDPLLETEAPFVGRMKEYPFQCPDVDRSQPAVLLFQSQGVSVQQPMTINGQTVFGGIPSSVEFAPFPLLGPQGQVGAIAVAQWSANVMLVTPGTLQENNLLRIESRDVGDDKVDSFIIDNLVVLFKTRSRPVLDPVVTDATRR